MGSRVIDQQAFATGCVHRKRKVPYSNGVKGTNYIYWIKRKYRGSWVWVFLRLFVSLTLIFIGPFNS